MHMRTELQRRRQSISANAALLNYIDAGMRDNVWTQKDLANATEYSESAISKFFRGERVSTRLAADCVKALGLNWKKASGLIDDETELVTSDKQKPA